jgi:hypothetical protein
MAKELSSEDTNYCSDTMSAIGKPHPYPSGLDKVAPKDTDADDEDEDSKVPAKSEY